MEIFTVPTLATDNNIVNDYDRQHLILHKDTVHITQIRSTTMYCYI
jgi:hypothetical protein